MTRVLGLFRLFVLALFATSSFQASAQTVSLTAGWNLVGNSSNAALDVSTAFNDTARVNTVWKWVASTSKWAFYAPSMSAAELQTYAASKDYVVLSSVNGGEGFWVNAKIAFSAQLPAGAAVTAASLTTSLVTPGWNLLSIGDNLTPEQVGLALGSPPISLWAWNPAQTNWYFYAASLVAQGATALADYIASKGYLDFGANPLSPTMGFWVNMAASTAPASSSTSTAASTSSTAATTTTTVVTSTTTTVPAPAATWFFADGAALTASQIASFDAQGLYFNVHSAANPGGEIRSQIAPASSAFVTDAGNPASSDIFSALLGGEQEVPANATKAGGYGTIVLDRVAKTISGVLVTNGISGTAAHIHKGLPGAAGSVVFPLTGGPTVWTLAATAITDAQIADLSAGSYYLNVHTTAAPGGEIRGQLNQQLRFADLSGANEPTAVTTAASGSGVLALNPTTNQISGFVKTSGITGTAAHIHEAAAGINGGVIVPLTQTPAGSGLWVVPAGQLLTAAQVASFNAGNLYFNVHSSANPGGELRGQIVAATIKVGTAALDGTKEVPAVTTGASGSGIMALNSITRLVNGNLKTTGINGTAAHVHAAAAGANGGVIVPLTQTAPVSTFQTAVAVSTTSLADGTAGAAYSQSLTASGGTTPYTWAVASGSLPAGLSLSAAGVISGTPSAAGSSSFTVGVTDSAATATTASKAYSINVAAAAVATVSYSAQIQPILSSNCTAGCHSSGGISAFMNLTAGISYASLVQSAPARVIAGNSAASLLYMKITGAAQPQMPLGGNPLSAADQALIKNWIDQGAANN